MKVIKFTPKDYIIDHNTHDISQSIQVSACVGLVISINPNITHSVFMTIVVVLVTEM